MARSPELALDTLLEHTNWVRALAAQLVRDPDDADDLAQETMLAALEADPVEIRSPRAWLSRVLRNVLWERVRRDERRTCREAAAIRPEEEPSSAELVERVDAHRAVVNAVMGMPEHYRLVLLRRYFLDESPTVIARTLAMPIATVKTRLQRGLEQLRGQLDDRYGGAAERRQALLPLVTLVPGLEGDRVVPSSSVAGVAIVTAAVTAVAVSALALWSTGVWRSAEPTPVPPPPTRTAAAGTAGEDPAPAMPDRTPAGVQSDAGIDWGAVKMPERALAGVALSVDGAPAPGLVLRFEPERDRGRGTKIALTGTDGAFELAASGSGFVTALSENVVTVLAAVAGTAAVRSDLCVVVAPRRRLAGRIVDMNHRPLALAEVAIELPAELRARFGARVAAARTESFAVTTGADGRFDLAAIPAIAGAQLVVRREGFGIERSALPAAATCEVVLSREPAPRGAIVGTVLDHDGSAARDVRVACGDAVTRTDHAGSFWLPRTAVGDRVIAVAPERLPASIARSAALDRERGELVLQLGDRPRAIRGQVVDGRGRPVRNACVWITDPTPFSFAERTCLQTALGRIGERSRSANGRSPNARHPEFVEDLLGDRGVPLRPAITGADGAFEITGLDARDYVVRAGQEKTLLRSDPQTIAAGADHVTLQLGSAVHERLRGRVVDELGRPLARVGVTIDLSICEVSAAGHPVFRQSYRRGAMVTGPDGEFFLYDVPVGDLRLRLHRAGYVGRTIELEAAIAGGLEVQLVREHTLVVEVVEPGAVELVAVIDAAGRALVVDIPRGNENQRTDRVPILGGRTEAFRLPATAVQVVGYRDGAIVRRAAVPAGGGRVTL